MSLHTQNQEEQARQARQEQQALQEQERLLEERAQARARELELKKKEQIRKQQAELQAARKPHRQPLDQLDPEQFYIKLLGPNWRKITVFDTIGQEDVEIGPFIDDDPDNIVFMQSSDSWAQTYPLRTPKAIY